MRINFIPWHRKFYQPHSFQLYDSKWQVGLKLVIPFIMGKDLEPVKLRRTQVQILRKIGKDNGLQQHKSLADNAAKAKIEQLAAEVEA